MIVTYDLYMYIRMVMKGYVKYLSVSMSDNAPNKIQNKIKYHSP